MQGKQINPVIWGGVLGLIAGGIIWFGNVTGQPPNENPYLQNPFSAAGIGFAWGWMIGLFRNWWVRRGK